MEPNLIVAGSDRPVGTTSITRRRRLSATHHLRVTHIEMGGTSESHYWFADDSADLRRVLVQFRGPYGVEYRLKRLDWWAYWSDPKPE